MDFWNLPYLYGIADIQRQDLIDMDECGIESSTANRTIGKSLIGYRVTQTGPYLKTKKYNLLIAISGDSTSPHRWRNIWIGEGTIGQRMITFIQQIIDDIGFGTPVRRYYFIMDNLRYVRLLLWSFYLTIHFSF